MNYLSQNELCYSIFSVKLDDNAQFSSLRPTFQSLVHKGKFPIINIKKYQSGYKNGVDFYTLLKKCKYSFPFDKTFLEEMCQNDTNINNEMVTSPDYIVLIALHFYITWYINFIENHSISDVLNMLKSLLIVMNMKNCKIVSKNRLFAASAFINICSEVVESTCITNLIGILPPIVEFLTLNEDLPTSSFDLLLKLGNRIIDPQLTTFTKDISHFVNFIVIIVRTCGNRFPKYIITAIVLLMSKTLIALDKEALLFFSRSIETLGTDTALDLISKLPYSLLDKIVSYPNPIFECKNLKNDQGLVFPMNEVAFEKKLVSFTTFDNDICELIKAPPYFPDLLSPIDLISSEVFELMELIYKIVEKSDQLKEILITNIISILSSCTITSHYYDIHAAFLYFLYVLSKNYNKKCISNEIFMSILFRQNDTIFNQSDDFQKINTIRHFVYLLLINQPKDEIHDALLKIRLKPYTFAEFVFRLLPDSTNIEKLLEISTPVFEGVMTAIIFYQQFQNFEEMKVPSSIARISGFTYIDILLKIPDFRHKFFESSICVDSMISLIFEEKVRKWVLLKIIDSFYLENTFLNYLIEKCIETFQISCQFGFTKGEIHQVDSLIRFLDHDIFNSKNQFNLLKSFEPVISDICGWVAGFVQYGHKESGVIQSNETSESNTDHEYNMNSRTFYINAYNKLLNILTRFAEVHTLSKTDISLINTTANYLYSDEPSDEFFEHLLCMIAGEFLQSTDPTFEIKQPKAMMLIFNLYNKSEKFLSKIDYIVSLAKYSTKNCEQLQKGELDLFLVRRLFNLRNDKDFSEKVFKQCLLILRLISAHSSSVSFVHQYISLFCPIECKIVPRFHQEILDSMQILIQNSVKEPSTSLPIFPTTQVKASNINLLKSFTIMFWFFIYSNEEPITMVEISNNDQKLSIEFLNGNINIYYQKNNEKWKGIDSFDLPLNQWSLATFSVHNESLDDRVVIQTAINGNILTPKFFPCFNFSENQSKVNVGITKSDKLSILLGSFGIISYFEPNQNVSLFDAGPRRIPKNALFFFTCQSKNDNYEIDVIPSTVKATIQKVRTLHKPSFTDILIDTCGVSVLIPIIANIYLAHENGIELPFLLEQFIEILEILLTLSSNSQKLFALDKGFYIISKILLSSKSIELNYKVFYRFCSLFELLDNEKCRSQLLFGILMKFDLWIRCDASNLKRILHYWNNTLVPLHLSLIMKNINFSDIIVALRLFFWYDSSETDIILCKEDRVIYQIEDVRACRKYLLSIAFMMAMNGLTNKEFKLIISQILSLNDKEQILDLLHFVDGLIDNHEKIAKNYEIVFESIIYLMFLYSTDSNIIELTIDIIIKAYRLSIIKEMTLENQFELMIYDLPGSYACPSILIKLLDICSTKEPKLFSLCAMIAFYFGQNSFNNLLNTLKPNANYCSTPTWCLWPVISLFKINDEEFQNRLFSFLINTSPDQWENIFWTIDYVGRALNINQEQFKKKFLLEIGKDLLKLTQPCDYLHHFFSLVVQFLFLLSYDQCSDIFESLFKEKSVKKEEEINKQITNDNKNDYSDSNENLMQEDSGQRRPRNNSRNKKQKASQISYRRRSSFRSFDCDSFTSKREKFMNLDFIKLRITSFISMIKYHVEKVNHKIYFGIRVNDDDIWEDIDVARMANQIFKKFPQKDLYNSCLFINSYMLMFDYENAKETVHSITINEEELSSYECSLYNKIAENLHHQKLFDEPPSSYLPKSFKFLKHFEKKYHDNSALINNYTSIINNYENAKKLYFIYENGISQIPTDIIADFKEKLSLINTKNSKYWNHFWRSMTIGRAPWGQSFVDSQKNYVMHFKRDLILCSSMCPFRMRPNNNFNNHKDASKNRDEGLSTNNNNDNNNIGILLSAINSSSSFSNIKGSLFNISNSILLESASDFNTEQSRTFNSDYQVDSSYEDINAFDLNASKCIFESNCEIITVSNKYDAFFSLQKESFVISKSVHKSHVIKNENITAVLTRTVLHRNTAIEIFLDDGTSFFVNFPEVNSSEIINQFRILKKALNNSFFLQTQPSKQLMSLSKCTLLWQNKKITNFDYLMILNMLSGRSFNNPSQYPFFPWILKDYKSDTLDIKNPEIYRDLSKPIGTLGKEKFEKIKITTEELPYLYSNGNVSPLIVFLWLVRVEPFATLQIKDQNESFDAPDRQFKSIEEAFNSVLTFSSDFRELIPEFFFQPEFLVNMNNFDLGISNEKRVNDVELPNWIKTDSKEPIVAAYEFIYMHRKAFESDYVSSHLNEWIDLTWGDKSRGKKAVECDNVYAPEMYPEIWDNQSKAEIENNIPTIETILSYVGQIPIQLFENPHPKRCNNVEKDVLDDVLNFQIERHQNSKIKIGAVIFSNDSNTIEILSIDENGEFKESKLDIKMLQKLSLNPNSQDNELTQNSTYSPEKHHNNSLISQGSKLIHRKSPNYQNIETINSHLDPATFDQTIWKPAFLSCFSQTQASFFVPANGFSKSNNIDNKSSSINLMKKFFIVDSYQKSDLYLIDPIEGYSEKIVRQYNDITSISTDGYKWLAVANKDSKIYVYSLDKLNKDNSSKHETDFDEETDEETNLLTVEFSIPSFRDYVKCCDISKSFHCLVCGTRDNSLIICSMATHSIVKIVELDAKPIRLIITPSWGFTVVCMKSISEGKSKYYLAVYGTNGYLLRKVEIENSVKKIIAWKDEYGFDFVFFVDSQNKCFVFEAFYCEIGNPVFDTCSNVVEIAYMESNNSVIAICEDGMVYLIPV